MDTPPPIPPEAPEPPVSGAWWFGWLLGVIVTPIALMMLIGGHWFGVAGTLLGGGLHLTSSMTLAGQSRGCGRPMFLLVGGWLFMVLVVFIGCASNSPY